MSRGHCNAVDLKKFWNFKFEIGSLALGKTRNTNNDTTMPTCTSPGAVANHDEEAGISYIISLRVVL
jgi:hypothetical protein